MAVIGKIRQRTGLLFIVILGAIALFLLQDFISTFSSSGKVDERSLASVNGYPLQREDLNKQYEAVKRPNTTAMQEFNQKNRLWETMVAEMLIKEEYEKLGLSLTTEGRKSEFSDMFGKNNIGITIPEALKQQFSPQGGEFDLNQMVNRIKEIESYNLSTLNPNKPEDAQKIQIYTYWQNYKSQLLSSRLKEKYESLLVKSTYVNSKEAELMQQEGKQWAEFNYLFIPFDSYTDTIKDSDLDLETIKKQYRKEYSISEETRSVELVAFSLKPNGKDSASLKAQFEEISQVLVESSEKIEISKKIIESNKSKEAKERLKIASFEKVKYEELDQFVKSNFTDSLINPGPINKVYGPFINASQKSSKIIKIGDVVLDSVYAFDISAIMIPAVPDETVNATRQAEIDSLFKSIQEGKEFATVSEEVLKKYSDEIIDTAKITSNGDYKEGIKSASDLIFQDAKLYDTLATIETTGLLETVVKTDVAFYIVKVRQTKYVKEVNKLYEQLVLDRLFVASNSTKNVVHRKTRDFADRAQNVEGFDNAVKADSLEKKVSKFELKASTAPQLYYNGLNLADEDRRLVRSIFKLKEPGTTAVLEIGEYYVVACLKSINKAGSIPASDEDKIKEEARNVAVSNIILDRLKQVAKTDIDLGKIAVNYNEKFELANKPKKAIREHVQKQTLDKNTIGRKEEPEVIGTIFGIKKGTRSSAFVGENGVYIVELLNKGTEAIEKEEPVVAEGEEKPKDPIRVLADEKAKAKENEIKRDYIKALKETGEVEDYRFRM